MNEDELTFWGDIPTKNKRLLLFGLLACAFLIALAVVLSFTLDSDPVASAAPAPETPARPALAPTTLSQGDRGDAVIYLQTTLRQLGYSVSVDGSFGPQTDKAVRHWQRANGLGVDGIVGPITASTFGGAQASALAVRLDPPRAQEPLPEPLPEVQAERVGCDAYRDLVEAEGMPWDWARMVMARESMCLPWVTNLRGNDRSYGLFQINVKGSNLAGWHRLCEFGEPADLLIPEVNIRCAGAGYRAMGKTPWRT
jgi:hypothetical protein